jgi:hypothetical protein
LPAPGNASRTALRTAGDTDLTTVTFKDNQLKIEIDTSNNTYSLTATLAAEKLTGEWSRNGQKQGTWEGKK